MGGPDDQQRGDGGPSSGRDPELTLRPQTASVLSALSRRGVDLPGVHRPAGDDRATAGAAGASPSGSPSGSSKASSEGATGGAAATDGATGDRDPAGDAGASPDGPDAPRYTVIDQLARGGMGVVLRVRDEDLRRELAMKVLARADRRGGDPLASDPRDLGRFLEEAQVTGQLDHPGVPAIHELGLDQDGRLFFTMKLVRGGTLADVIAGVHNAAEGWSTTRALGVVLKVCEALAYAHHKGVIHRDIKPANIMVGRFGETYVMDWGLARVLDELGRAGDGGDDDADSPVSRSIVHTDRREAGGDQASSLATLDGDVVGTPAYMAPEQARGDLAAVGPHSDLYAVGALLYHLLAGQPPYLAPGTRVSPHTVLRWVIDGPPRPLSELAPDAPPELVAVVEKAMHREPGLRYATMLELAADLQAFIDGRVVQAYQTGAWAEARKWVVRNKPLAAAAALLLLVTVGALGAISWIQADARSSVEERNELLGEANAALAGSNAQLAAANTALDAERLAAERARDEADAERAAAVEAREQAQAAQEQAEQARELAEQAREQAETNAELAAANEARALEASYAANMTAAAGALQDGAGEAARRHLAACPDDRRGWAWEHLSLRADPSLAVWEGSESLLWDVRHSPDGRLLATAAGPFFAYGAPVAEARLIDAASGETLQVLPADSTVTEAAFSPDGRLLAWSQVGQVRFWDVERGRVTGNSHWTGQLCLALEFLDDERLLVLSGAVDAPLSRLEILDTSRNEVLYSLENDPAGEATLTAAAATPDGTRVVIGRDDLSVELRGLPDGELLWRLPGQDVEQGIASVACDGSGRRLLVTEVDGLVRLLDAADGRELARQHLDEEKPRSPRFHPDGPWVVLADQSGSVRFLDAETLVEIERLAGHDRGLTSVSISPDGDQLVSAGFDGRLRVWDGRPGAASLRLVQRAVTEDTGFSLSLRSICFSPDGRHVAWNASPRATLLADALTGEVLYRLAEADSAVSGMAFTPDGRHLLVVAELALRTFDVSDGSLVSSVPSGRYGPWASFDPTRQLMAKVENRSEHRIELRLVSDGSLAGALLGHTDAVSAGVFTADSQRLVSCSVDGSLRVWDLRSGRVLQQIDTGEQLLRLALFDDDRKAVTTSMDPRRTGLSVWDLEAGERIRFLPARSGMMLGALHPDGSCWAGAGQEHTVGLWDLELGELFGLPIGDSRPVMTCFDPSGARLAAVDEDGDLHLFDTLHARERGVVRRDASRLARRAGEARALVDALRAEHLMMERALEALAAAPGLDDDLREAAARDLRVRGDGGPWTLERLWARLLPEGVPDDQLATAPAVLDAARDDLALTEAVHQRWVEYQDAWEPRIWALFVLGRAAEAAPLCEQALATGYSFEPDGPQVTRVLQALISAELGESERAQVELARARDEYERALFDAPGDLSDLAVTRRLLAFAETRLGDG